MPPKTIYFLEFTFCFTSVTTTLFTLEYDPTLLSSPLFLVDYDPTYNTIVPSCVAAELLRLH